MLRNILLMALHGESIKFFCTKKLCVIKESKESLTAQVPFSRDKHEIIFLVSFHNSNFDSFKITDLSVQHCSERTEKCSFYFGLENLKTIDHKAVTAVSSGLSVWL